MNREQILQYYMIFGGVPFYWGFLKQCLVLLTGTKFAIYPTLITTYGLVPNSYSERVQSVVTLADLF